MKTYFVCMCLMKINGLAFRKGRGAGHVGLACIEILNNREVYPNSLLGDVSHESRWSGSIDPKHVELVKRVSERFKLTDAQSVERTDKRMSDIVWQGSYKASKRVESITLTRCVSALKIMQWTLKE